MKLVINNIPIIVEGYNYNPKNIIYELGIKSKDQIVASNMVGNVLVKGGKTGWLEAFLELFGDHKLKKLKSITFLTDDLLSFEKYLDKKVKYIEAAGGLVVDGDRILMIYRLGKWDLPKGKLEKKESVEDGAVREVEEECNIKVRILEHLNETWHTYHQKKKLCIKKTYWYLMECLDDSEMMPQLDEGIEKVEWKTNEEAKELLKNTYKNIRGIVKNYHARYES